MNNRVMHFEIPSDNPKKNIKFFKDVFGWKFSRFGKDEYWLAKTGNEKFPGINGAVMKKVHPKQPVVNTIAVKSLEGTIKKIKKAGGKIVKPKMTIPKVGWLAFFADPDGNIHGVIQPMKAKK